MFARFNLLACKLFSIILAQEQIIISRFGHIRLHKFAVALLIVLMVYVNVIISHLRDIIYDNLANDFVVHVYVEYNNEDVCCHTKANFGCPLVKSST